MNNKIFQTALLAVLASMIFYCGATYRASVPDAVADDAGADAGQVCDCPPAPEPPVCIACPSRMTLTGVFVSTYEEINAGTIPLFDPDGDTGMPTVQRWYYDDNRELWLQGTFYVSITNAGNVIIQSNALEYVNREFKVILTWVAPNHIWQNSR